MQSPMQVHDDGKRTRPAASSSAPGSFFKELAPHHLIQQRPNAGRPLHLCGRQGRYVYPPPLPHRWLVDCDATVSFFPASLQDQMTRPQTSPFLAANGSHIATYGTREVRLHLGFRRTSCSFRLANVTKPKSQPRPQFPVFRAPGCRL